jgi:hypothetical protein
MRKLMTRLLKKFASWILQKELSTLKGTITSLDIELEKKQLLLLQAVNEKPAVKIEVRAVVPQERFDLAVSKLPAMLVNGTSTELQVAALVGQQQTVDALRKALVVGT